MIDHMGLPVQDTAASKRFYEQALAPLGYGIVMEFEQACAFGPPGRPQFWVVPGTPSPSAQHIAFAARDRAGVDAFYAAAMAAGGQDNGPPGERPIYHPGYYGAFVLDPDGYNVEAVCHEPA